MSERQSTVLNGPSGELTIAFKDPPAPQDVKPLPPSSPQPPYPQQINENYQRPQLTRIDSRSSIQTRPNLPNQQFIPPRSPIPPGQPQYLQRSPAGQPQRPPPQPGFVQSPRPNVVNQGFRPSTPFPRPQFNSGPRPQGIFQQRSVPAPGQQRAPFSGETLLRSQTLDQSEYPPRNNGPLAESNVRPPMNAPLNRSISLSSSNVEPPSSSMEDRRRSVSSVESIGDSKVVNSSEEGRSSRPESRGSLYMNRIAEDDDSGVAQPKVPMQRREEYPYGRQASLGESKNQPSVPIPPKIESKPANSDAIRGGERVVNADMSKTPVTPRKEDIKQPDVKIEPPRMPTPVRREENVRINETSKPAEYSSKVEPPRTPMPTRKVDEQPVTNSKPIEQIKQEVPKTPIVTRKEETVKTVDSKPTVEESRKSPESEKPNKGRRTPDVTLPLNTKSPYTKEGDNDSGVDESTQGNDQSINGHASPRKSVGKLPFSRTSSTVPSRSASRGAKSPNPKTPDSVSSDTPGTAEKRKVPMNKIQVGSAPSPNLKVVKSKIGSLQNANYKPGGGHVKIENRKIEIKAQPRIAAKNEAYVPGGGDKKIQQQKLQWNAKSKIGSLENATHKPKGGDKKIESVKLDWKAKPKVGSKDNVKHVPGGGDVKFDEDEEHRDIENRKLDIKVQSKVGSMDNVKHKPGGGDKKIFDDKDYLRQKSAMSNENNSLTGSQNSLPSHTDAREPVSDENLNREK